MPERPDPPDPPAPGSEHPHEGPLNAEDARSIFAAVQAWALQALPAPPSGHPGPECQWCPLCQLASVLRGEHPELTDRLAEASAAVTGAVRALLDSAPRPGGSTPAATSARTATPAPAASAEAPARRPRPRVEHIELDDSGER